MTSRHVDVVVVGGGAAGLSAATALARSRRSVVVVDAGEPRNAPARGVHNYLAHDGIAPVELVSKGRSDLAAYGGEVLDGTATAVARTAEGFAVQVGSDEIVARRLVVTTGLVDELPDVPGLLQRWGRDVLHCPFCHGWEVRGQAIGVLATGPAAVHQAQLFRALSPDVTVFTHKGPGLSDDDSDALTALGTRVVEGEVVGLDVTDDRLTGVCLADGSVVSRQALVVAPRFVARSELLVSLGLEVEDVEMGGVVIAQRIPADPRGATSVPGVWVAGNVTDPMAQVVAAAAQGLAAGAAVHADLVAADTRRALELQRATADLRNRDSWEERYGSTDKIWSGKPNPQLVAEVAGLAPGRALDVGCGEGADALWLARAGWQVTAVDFSAAALARAEKEAIRENVSVDWQQVDLAQSDAGIDEFDLVSAQYFHWPPAPRAALFTRLARAVRPGGTLLIVGHYFPDPSMAPRPDMQETFYTAADVAALLDPSDWDVVVAELRPRSRTHPETGEQITIQDAVLHARRR
jgi:thioredoxin reductase/SAM-dependent methyltransferase